MTKNINIYLNDDEFLSLKKVKGDKTWREFVLLLLELVKEEE